MKITRILHLIVTLLTLTSTAVHAWDWTPSEEDILKYRKSWNQLSNGPIMIASVDIQPKGQFTIHPFLFGQVSEKRFGNQLTTERMPSSAHLYAISPLVTTSYGLTDHLEASLRFTQSTFGPVIAPSSITARADR